MAGSTRGASSALTEAGPPDRMMAEGAISRTSSAVMSHGTISEYTFKSRTRRAISCPYCAPKSNTTTFWLVELDDAVLTRRLLLRLYHAARPRLRLHFCLRIRINDCTVSCANPYLSAVHLQYNATQGSCAGHGFDVRRARGLCQVLDRVHWKERLHGTRRVSHRGGRSVSSRCGSRAFCAGCARRFALDLVGRAMHGEREGKRCLASSAASSRRWWPCSPL